MGIIILVTLGGSFLYSPRMDIFLQDQEVGLPSKTDLLDPKLETFLTSYLETSIIAEAEREAGYSIGYGKKLLARDDIQLRLQEIRDKTLSTHGGVVDRIIKDLEAICDLDPIEAYELALSVRSIVVRHDSSKGDDGISIEEVTAELTKIPPHIRKMMDISFTAKGIQIRYPDKLKARELLLKIQGAFAPTKIDLNIPLLGNINVIEGS